MTNDVKDTENTEQEESIQTIHGYLIVDWNTSQARFRKTEPKAGKRGRTEIEIPIHVQIRIPEIDIPEIATDITIPPAQVKSALVEDPVLFGENDDE